MINKGHFVRWWVIILAFTAMMFWSVYFGVVNAVLAADVTRITVLTFALFVVSSAVIGWNTYRLNYNNIEEVESTLEIGWFISEFCTSLGLLGTVIGFILMMTTQLSSANPGDAASMITLIANISMSLGTALYTTAVGIGTGMMLKVQCLNLQHVVDNIKRF